MVHENMNLSEDKIGRSPFWSNYRLGCLSSVGYSVYFNCTLISYVHWTSKYLISVRKLHALPFTLCYELNSVRVYLLISKGDG
jgi:hypothetical protein